MKTKILTVLFLFISAITFGQNADIEKELFLGEEACDNQDYPKAIKHISKYLEVKKTDTYALYMRSRCYFLNNDIVHFFGDINKAIENYTQDTLVSKSLLISLRGFGYKSTNDNKNAKKDFDIALGIDPYNTTALSLRADYYRSFSDYDASNKDLLELLKIEPSDIESMKLLGENYLEIKKYDEAVKTFDKIHAIDSSLVDIYRSISHALYESGRYDEAVDIALKHFEKTKTADDFLIHACCKNRYDYSIKKIVFMYNQNPNDNFWLGIKSTFEIYKSDWKNLILTCNEIDRIFDELKYYTYYQRGNAYLNLGIHDKAIESFSELIDHSEDDVYLYIQRGDAYRLNAQYDLALIDYTKASTIGSADFSHYRMGWIYEMKRNFDKAMEEYTTAININPDARDALMMRGKLFLMKGDTISAHKDAEKLLKLDTTIVNKENYRCYALLILGRYDEAKQWINNITNRSEVANGDYYDATCVYNFIGEYDKAIECLNKAFEMGYRDFNHIIIDDDMDVIRENPKFKSLVKKYKAIHQDEIQMLSEMLNW